MAKGADTPLTRALRRLIEEKGTQPKKLSLAAGLGATYVRDLLEGRSKSPEASKLAKIEDALGADPGTLLRLLPLPEEAEVVTDPRERLLLSAWRQLGEEQRKATLLYVEFLTSQLPRKTDNNTPPA